MLMHFSAKEWRTGLLTLLALMLLWGCTPAPHNSLGVEVKVPAPLRAQIKEVDSFSAPDSSGGDKEAPKTRFSRPPSASVARTVAARPKAKSKSELNLEGPPIGVNIENLSLPAFINEVYGNLLGLSFQIDPKLQQKRDLVTLRVTEPQLPADLYLNTNEVLANYGVAVKRSGDMLRFVFATWGSSGAPPLLVSGRSHPTVPISHRPVFQIVPLHKVRSSQVMNWMTQAFRGQPLEISEDPQRNAIILNGGPEIVAEGLEAVRVLDQAAMRGRHSLRIEPLYQSPTALADGMLKVLETEGFGVSKVPGQGSIVILPLEGLGAVLVFAADKNVLNHARRWGAELDRPSLQRTESGIYYYAVKNTRAESLVSVLNQVFGDGTSTENNDREMTHTGKGGLVVDEFRNALLYRGTAENWARLLEVIKDMDVPPRQVLIEVTVAEVTLTDEQHTGIEWVLENADILGADGVLGTLGNLGIQGSGLTYTLNNAGQFRAALNAFAADSRVKLLSTPRIMVKSGQEASIDVGSEVPIITSQSTSSELTEDGNSAILQEIQYRKTGVLLKVKPIVHAGRRVDLDVSQEVSEAQPTVTSDISSPSIFNRQITTSLSVQDGGSVLLGGLISRNESEGTSGVPILSRIPFLGRLFRVDSESSIRTELIIMIVPYVIADAREAEEITDTLKGRLGFDDESGIK